MKKYLLVVTLCLLFVSVLFAANKYEAVDKSTAKTYEGPARIHTPIIKQQSRAIMINEGFEGTFPPTGWDTLSAPGGSQGGPTLIPWHKDANYYYSGSYGAAYGWGYNLDGWMRILNLDFSQVANCTLSWWWESSYYWHVSPNDNGDLFVQVSTDNGVTWDTLWTFGDSTMVVNSGVPWPWANFTWYQSTISLDAYAYQPNVWVGFHVVANDNADIGVDDVVIDTVGGVAAFWDFEDGLQGWTHTNGQAFPAGWDVESSGIHSGDAPPDPGDSTMWIDSDAGGAAFWIQDTALSPVITPIVNMMWLKYGYCNAEDTDPMYQNELRVGLRYFTGGMWNAVELAYYPANTMSGPAWDSADVSAYATADSVQVYFYFDDLNTWGYYASFDNVGLYPPPVHDVACTEITSPPEGWPVAAGDYDVIGRIRNLGDVAETFDAVATVYDTLDAWTVVFTQTITFTDFPVDGDSLHNFGLVTFEEDKVYCTEIYTTLVGDANPGNDTSAIYSSTRTFDVVWDFETGWQGWTHTSGQVFPAAWDVVTTSYVPSGGYWTYQAPPDAGDSAFIIDDDAAGIGVSTIDTVMSPVVVNPGFALLKWGYYVVYDTMEVLVREWTGSWGSWNVVAAYRGTIGPAWDSVDVSAFTGDSIQVAFYYDDEGYWAYGATFDNVMLDRVTGIAEEPINQKPHVFGFAPNMSTMAMGHVSIAYATTVPGHVSLKVYDSMGRLVQTLVNGHQPAGEKSLVWNNKDINNRTVANGVYFLKLEAQNKIATRKLILVK